MVARGVVYLVAVVESRTLLEVAVFVLGLSHHLYGIVVHECQSLDGDGYHRGRGIPVVGVEQGILARRLHTIPLACILDAEDAVHLVAGHTRAFHAPQHGRVLPAVALAGVCHLPVLSPASRDGERLDALRGNVFGHALWDGGLRVELRGVDVERQQLLVAHRVYGRVLSVGDAYLLGMSVAGGEQGLYGTLQVAGGLFPARTVGFSVVQVLFGGNPQYVHLVLVGRLQFGVHVFVHAHVYVGLLVGWVGVVADAEHGLHRTAEIPHVDVVYGIVSDGDAVRYLLVTIVVGLVGIVVYAMVGTRARVAAIAVLCEPCRVLYLVAVVLLLYYLVEPSPSVVHYVV